MRRSEKRLSERFLPITGLVAAFLVHLAFIAPPAQAQHRHPPPPPPQEKPKASSPPQETPDREHDHAEPSPASEEGQDAIHDHAMEEGHVSAGPVPSFLMRQASGTSVNPAAVPMHMGMLMRGDWNVMLHGIAFFNGVMQTGPRGEDEIFSSNWIMGMAERPLGAGHVMLRSMLSLEPATVRDGYYPELFQTGETADGEPIVDGQHPHDFFMELAAEYARPVGGSGIAYFYAAFHGDPALGPVAFPHRSSASEIPQAALSHHIQDSTHIAGSVITGGLQQGRWRFEASGFHGQEPDEERWDLDMGGLDSWAARIWYEPTDRWAAQISTGRLEHPEAHSDEDIQRTTASLSWFHPGPSGHWSGSLVFGTNHLVDAGEDLYSWLAESEWKFLARNYITARLEIVDRDELFPDEHRLVIFQEPHPPHGEIFRIGALTLGYVREVWQWEMLQGAAGGNVTLYDVPSELEPFYGSSPESYYGFFRIRFGSHEGAM